MGKILQASDILDANDLKSSTVELEVPEWGGTVLIRPITAYERDRFDRELLDEQGQIKMSNVRATLAALSLVDEEGNNLFTRKDIQKLGAKSASALDRVFVEARKVSKIGKEAIEELQENLD